MSRDPMPGPCGAFSRELSIDERLAQDQLLLAAIVESSDDAILTKDRAGMIRTFNGGAERLYDYTADEAIGQPVSMLIPPERIEDDQRVFDRVLAGERIRYFDTERVAKGGRRISVSMSLSPLLDPAGRIASASSIARDVSERRQAQRDLAASEQRFRFLATHDDITGLANRAAFTDQLATLFDQEALPLWVLLVDLDRFKVVNDSLGHALGDDVLADTGRRLLDCAGPLGPVARFGSDQFVIALAAPAANGAAPPLVTAAAALQLAERIHEALRRPFPVGDQEVYTTASIGIAGRSDVGVGEAADLVRHADAALQVAKDRGRDRTEIFDSALRDVLHQRLHLRNELHQALAGGQFQLLYQPEVSIATGQIVGVEALLRWDHPTRGILSAAGFIIAAEEEGVTIPLTSHVVQEATRQLREWVNVLGDRAPFVAINYSARQLNHPAAVAELAAAIDARKLDPALLVIELTETTIMDDADCSLTRLRQLKNLGVGLAVDDFGTGYSSLSYLKRFPVDTLKIDRSFIDGVCDDVHDAAITAAVVGLARALDLSVTAEGIEQTEQLDAVRRMGCDLAQGFLLGRPQSASSITEQLRTQP